MRPTRAIDKMLSANTVESLVGVVLALVALVCFGLACHHKYRKHRRREQSGKLLDVRQEAANIELNDIKKKVQAAVRTIKFSPDTVPGISDSLASTIAARLRYTGEARSMVTGVPEQAARGINFYMKVRAWTD